MQHQPNSAEALCALAEKKCASGDYQEAISALKKAIVIEESWNSYKILGEVLFMTKQYSEAIYSFRKSLTLKKHWSSYDGLGWALCNRKQYSEAYDAFKQSIAIKKNWSSYRGIGQVLIKLEQFETATIFFERSLQFHTHWKSYLGLGRALSYREKYDKAIDAFEKSIAIKKNWNSYKSLGWALSKSQKYTQAIQAFKESISIKENWDTYRGLGENLFKINQYPEAIDALCKSIKHTEHWESYYYLGEALHKINKYRDGLDSLIRSWKMNQNEYILNKIIQNICQIYPKDFTLLCEDFSIAKLNLIFKSKYILREGNEVFLRRIKESMNTGFINPVIIWLYSVISSLNQNGRTKPDHTSSYKVPIVIDNAISVDKFSQLLDSKNILSFGESHGRIFTNISSVKHVQLDASTAYSINNPKSSSGSYRMIMTTLEKYEPNQTSIIFTLGEVDLRAHIHKQSRIQNKIPELIVRDVIKNYMTFLDKLLSLGYQLLVNCPHAGGTEDQASVSMRERNDMCYLMNRLLYNECRQRNILCASLHDVVVDNISRNNITQFFYDQFHLHLPVNEIGKSLQLLLISRFFVNAELFDKSSNQTDDINGICKILASTIPGLQTLNEVITNRSLSEKRLIKENSNYYALIELPFPILIKKISLEFESEKQNNSPTSECQSIYEQCDPKLISKKNVFKGKSIINNDSLTKKVKITHDFSKYNFDSMHSRYVFISIANAKNTRITKLQVSRMKFI